VPLELAAGVTLVGQEGVEVAERAGGRGRALRVGALRSSWWIAAEEHSEEENRAQTVSAGNDVYDWVTTQPAASKPRGVIEGLAEGIQIVDL